MEFFICADLHINSDLHLSSADFKVYLSKFHNIQMQTDNWESPVNTYIKLDWAHGDHLNAMNKDVTQWCSKHLSEFQTFTKKHNKLVK